MARPRKYINKDEFEKLCGLQCTKQEICGWFDVTDKTLDAWVKRTYRSSFSEAFGQKRSTGRISLRKSQFRTARSNPFMIASRNVVLILENACNPDTFPL